MWEEKIVLKVKFNNGNFRENKFQLYKMKYS